MTGQTYSIDHRHPFFDEILEFYLLGAATSAVGLHREALRDISKLVDAINDLNAKVAEGQRAGLVPSDTVYHLPDFPEKMVWQEPGCPDDCVLDLGDDIVMYLIEGATLPNQLVFHLTPTVQTPTGPSPFPPAPEGYTAIDGFVPTTLFETILCYLIGGAYERQKDRFKAKHGALAAWPPELQFFRHLRNGCFHKNRFRIDPVFRKVAGVRQQCDQIDVSNPPTWHTYTMPSDLAMNGQKAIGQNAFFKLPHILPFLHDMGNLA